MIVDYFDKLTRVKVWDLDEDQTYGVGEKDTLYFGDEFKMTIKEYYEEVRIAHLWQEGPPINQAIIILN